MRLARVRTSLSVPAAFAGHDDVSYKGDSTVNQPPTAVRCRRTTVELPLQKLHCDDVLDYVVRRDL